LVAFDFPPTLCDARPHLQCWCEVPAGIKPATPIPSVDARIVHFTAQHFR
jgi:hypothetical protein